MPMTLAELEKHLKTLRLHGMARSLQARLLQAQQAGAPGLELLAALAQDELDFQLVVIGLSVLDIGISKLIGCTLR